MADDLSISVSLRSFAADMDDRDECTREDRDMLRAAADEIERLRAEVADLLYVSADLLAKLSANKSAGSALEREKIIAERDEARREVCIIMGGKGGRSSYISPDAVDYANSRGWDCFKENTDG